MHTRARIRKIIPSLLPRVLMLRHDNYMHCTHARTRSPLLRRGDEAHTTFFHQVWFGSTVGASSRTGGFYQDLHHRVSRLKRHFPPLPRHTWNVLLGRAFWLIRRAVVVHANMRSMHTSNKAGILLMHNGALIFHGPTFQKSPGFMHEYRVLIPRMPLRAHDIFSPSCRSGVRRAQYAIHLPLGTIGEQTPELSTSPLLSSCTYSLMVLTAPELCCWRILA